MQNIMKLRGRLIGAAVAGLVAFGAATAHADSVDNTTTVNAGVLAVPTNINIGASVSSGLTDAEFSTSSGIDINNFQIGVGSQLNIFTYDFKLGSGFSANTLPPELNIAFNGGTGLSYVPQGANVVLFDKTDGTALDVVGGTGGAVTLSSLLWQNGTGASHIGDTFEIALFLPASFKGTIIGLGSVPIPGALLLFGSALVGLGAFGARRRKSGPAA